METRVIEKMIKGKRKFTPQYKGYYWFFPLIKFWKNIKNSKRPIENYDGFDILDEPIGEEYYCEDRSNREDAIKDIEKFIKNKTNHTCKTVYDKTFK